MARSLRLTEIEGYNEFPLLADIYYQHYAKSIGSLLDSYLKANPLEVLAEEGTLVLGVRLEMLPFRASKEPVLVLYAKTGKIKGVNLPLGSGFGLEAVADGAMAKIPLSLRQGDTNPIVPVKIAYNP